MKSLKLTNSTDRMVLQEIELGYWPFAGRHMPAVFVLEILQIPYKLVTLDPQSWYGKKRDELQLDFKNLPYLIDHSTGMKITEIHTIVNYLLYKANCNKWFQEITRVGLANPIHPLFDEFKIDEIRFILNDIFTQISSAIAKSPAENSIKHMKDTVLPKFNMLSRFVEQANVSTIDRDHYFIMGYLSIADAYFYIISRYFQQYFPTLYQEYAVNFDLLRKSFEQIPQIEKYINSGSFPNLG